MSMKLFLVRILTLLFILLIPVARAEKCSDPNPLHFSFMTKTNAAEQAQHYQPLLNLLEKKVGRKIEIILPTSYDTAIEGLLSGQIDFAEMGPAAYAQAKHRDSSVEVFATYARPKGTFNEQGIYYHSLLIVRADSPYKEINSLSKAKISLVDPASTSGALIPRVLFAKDAGMPLEDFFGGIVYSGSHERSAQAVLNGHSQAAFVSSALLDESIVKGLFKNTDFRVLWRSAIIPNEPTAYRNNLCKQLKEQIRAVYFNGGEELAPLLAKLKAERFVPVNDEDYKIILDMSILR
ncbi:MAG: phosphate/phosphite/phosphonate ABC transporter substrate-binding protein [Methylococcaceae bacterium]